MGFKDLLLYSGALGCGLVDNLYSQLIHLALWGIVRKLGHLLLHAETVYTGVAFFG